MDTEQIVNLQIPLEFTSRPLSLAEAGQAVDLANRYSQAYLGINTEILENDLIFWQTPGFNLTTDTCTVYNGQGKMVGFSEFWDGVEPHIRFNVWIVVHPEYENLGIGSFLLAWADRRAQAALAFSPPGARVVMRQGADSQEKKRIAFLQNHGFQQVRDFYHMHIELNHAPEKPVVPNGYEIRPYRGDDERREMFRALWESFKDHWGFVNEPFENYLQRWLHWEKMKSFDPSLWYVAVKDGEVCGGCICNPDPPEDPEMGWVNTLGVRRAFRKNGLGLAMLRIAFAEFYQRGKKRVGLGVDATNLTGALALYEKAGMHIAKRQHAFQKVLREGIDLSTQELNA